LKNLTKACNLYEGFQETQRIMLKLTNE
jgi:hypothetical protein